jgi:hypothetical protein
MLESLLTMNEVNEKLRFFFLVSKKISDVPTSYVARASQGWKTIKHYFSHWSDKNIWLGGGLTI